MLETLEMNGYNTASVEGRAYGMPTVQPGSGYSALSENSRDRDNQQVRSANAMWLAAMLECEGTFTFQYNEQQKGNGLHSHIQPRVIFVNSDFKLVDKVEEVMVEFGFVPYRNGNVKGGLGKKLKAELQYNGFKCLPLLKMLRPFMFGEKAEAADCMIEFIEYRFSLQRQKLSKKPYGEKEFALLRRVRKINSGHWAHTPKLSLITSTTVRQRREAAWKAADAKIQSVLHGDMQRAAEMTAPLSERSRSRRRKVYADYGQR